MTANPKNLSLVSVSSFTLPQEQEKWSQCAKCSLQVTASRKRMQRRQQCESREGFILSPQHTLTSPKKLYSWHPIRCGHTRGYREDSLINKTLDLLSLWKFNLSPKRMTTHPKVRQGHYCQLSQWYSTAMSLCEKCPSTTWCFFRHPRHDPRCGHVAASPLRKRI